MNKSILDKDTFIFVVWKYFKTKC